MNLNILTYTHCNNFHLNVKKNKCYTNYVNLPLSTKQICYYGNGKQTWQIFSAVNAFTHLTLLLFITGRGFTSVIQKMIFWHIEKYQLYCGHISYNTYRINVQFFQYSVNIITIWTKYFIVHGIMQFYCMICDDWCWRVIYTKGDNMAIN